MLSRKLIELLFFPLQIRRAESVLRIIGFCRKHSIRVSGAFQSVGTTELFTFRSDPLYIAVNVLCCAHVNTTLLTAFLLFFFLKCLLVKDKVNSL